MKTIVANIDPTTPVDTIDLSSNKLTRMPKNLTKFNELVNLNISSNAIAAIESGDLTMTGSVTNLDMSSNLIATIADSSLPGELFVINSTILDQNLIPFFCD